MANRTTVALGPAKDLKTAKQNILIDLSCKCRVARLPTSATFDGKTRARITELSTLSFVKKSKNVIARSKSGCLLQHRAVFCL